MEQNLADEIKLHFSSSRNGIRPLDKLIDDNETFTIKEEYSYGVGVVNRNNVIINEKFANVFLTNKNYVYNGEEINLLVLSSTLFSHHLEFSYLCAQFVTFGPKGENRKALIQNPLTWWEKWQELLGNSIKNQTASAVIGELYVYYMDVKNGQKTSWLGPESSSHDLQNENYHIEVKSTLSKYKNEITISSQFQLKRDNDLYIAFIKLEESMDGYSINGLINELKMLGQDYSSINKMVVKLGFEEGSSIRDNKKYRVNELRYYRVDESFPQITEDQFKGNKFPNRIKKIVYDIDLEGIEYDVWYQ